MNDGVITPQVIYVAGPYSAPTPLGIDNNVAAAVLVGQEIMRRGHAALVPHSMTHGWEHAAGLSYDDFIRCDIMLLESCDAICMVRGWQSSPGAVNELETARRIGLLVYESVDDVPPVSGWKGEVS